MSTSLRALACPKACDPYKYSATISWCACAQVTRSAFNLDMVERVESDVSPDTLGT